MSKSNAAVDALVKAQTHLRRASRRLPQQGRRVRFTTVAPLMTELQESQDAHQLGRAVRRYAGIEL